MKRLLIFAGTLLGAALLIVLLVVAPTYRSIRTLLDNQAGISEGSEWVEKTFSLKGLTEYIAEFPDRVSVVSITPGRPDSSLFLRENEPRTMGTLSNLLLMTAWADAFDRGVASPDEPVRWEEIEQLQLPGFGGILLKGARESALESGALNREETIRLEDALALLPRHNSPALADYLLLRLGEERLRETLDRLDLEQTDFPIPFSGLMMTFSPALQEKPAQDLFSEWKERGREPLRRAAWESSLELSRADGEARQEIVERFDPEKKGLSFIEERDMLALWPRTTAAEMVRLLEQMHREELLSPQVSRQVREWMQYPMDRRVLTRNFREYGALYDNRMGLLNGIDFGRSAYNGKPAIQAVFFDRIHIAVWLHMSSNHMHQDFQQRLIWDPELFSVMDQVVRTVEPQKTSD